MSLYQRIIMIGMFIIGTMITRFLPFIAFPKEEDTPSYIKYLGRVLPPATLGLLVVYSLKNINPMAKPYGVPEILSIALILGLHKWKGKMILSIGAGTVFYMILVQVFF